MIFRKIFSYADETTLFAEVASSSEKLVEKSKLRQQFAIFTINLITTINKKCRIFALGAT